MCSCSAKSKAIPIGKSPVFSRSLRERRRDGSSRPGGNSSSRWQDVDWYKGEHVTLNGSDRERDEPDEELSAVARLLHREWDSPRLWPSIAAGMDAIDGLQHVHPARR